MTLVVYLLSKVGGLFFRAGAASQKFGPQQRRPVDGNINVNTPPKENKRGGIKGGDYVDYEEVK